MNSETEKLNARKQKLRQAIEFTKQKKKEIIEISQKLASLLGSKQITREEYEEKLKYALKNRTAEQWIKYYDDYLNYYDYQINLCNRLIKKAEYERIKTRIKQNAAPVLKISIVIVAAALMFSLIFILKPLGTSAFTKIGDKFSSTINQIIEKGKPAEEITEYQEPTLPVSLEDREVKISNEQLTQYQAVLGKPVKWKKQFTTDSLTGFNIKLPENSENVKIKANGENITDSINIKEEFFGKQINVRLKTSSITGNVIEDGTNNEQVSYEVEYETPAPTITEINDSNAIKHIKINGPDDVHYKNILSFAELSEEMNENKIRKLKLKQISENGQSVDKNILFTAYDTDENGMYDYIEWITPELSEAEFLLIIEISKTEHLDFNKQFISDIYNETYQLDDIWSEEIKDNEYVRVTFRQKLDNTRDITIYLRVVNGSPKIEVYEADGTEKIAEFEDLIEGKNTIYLTNLPEGYSQDVFDLRVAGGSLQLDWIVDPVLKIKAGTNSYTANYLQTISFANTMPSASYSILFSGQQDDDAPFAIEWTNKQPESFKFQVEDDGGANETAGIEWAVLEYGEYKFNNFLIKCNIGAGTSIVAINFASSFPDTNYAVVASTPLDDDSPRISYTGKSAGSWTSRIEDDDDNLEDVSSIDWCAVSYGSATIGNTIIKAGVNTASGATSKVISLGSAFPNTNYAVVTTASMADLTADPCEVEVSSKTTTTFTITAEDDDTSNNCNNREFNWIAVSSGEFFLDTSLPSIVFTNPTLQTGAFSQNFIPVNVSASDAGTGDNNVSTFIDFNKSLVGWWRMDDYDDNFDSGFDSNKWALGEINGKVKFINGDINQTCNLGACNLDVKTKNLFGNIDVQVDFNLINFPAVDSYAELLIEGDADKWLRIERYRTSTVNQYRAVYDGGIYQTASTTDNSGKFRIARSGDLFTFYYWGGSSWTQLGTSQTYLNSNFDPSGDGIRIWLRTESSQSAEVHFDNFILSSPGTAVDFSSYYNQGKIFGAVQAEGKSGKAMSFDGVDDYINVSSSPNLDITNSITLIAWVKASSSQPSGHWGRIIDKYRYVAKEGYDLIRNANTNKARFEFWDTVEGENFVDSTTTITDNNWHHLSATFNGTTLKIYVDGNLENTTNLAGVKTIKVSTNNLGIGGNFDAGSWQWFNGSVDDVMIFNRALSSEEIAALYANSSQKYLFNNFTDLNPGNYTFKAYAQDTAGNVNWTETREVKLLETGPIVTMCRNLDISNMYYNLTQSIIIGRGNDNCINITAQNITFDCQGNYIYLPGDNFAGIYSGSLNTTIKNCNITMSSADGGFGIYLQGANNSYIFNNILNNNRYGTRLVLTTNARVENNTANKNSYGIYLSSSSNNILIDNLVNLNLYNGLILVSSSNNTLTNNIVNNNTFGIAIGNSNSNILRFNTANNNSDIGIYLQSSSNNQIISNKFNDNLKNDTYLTLTSLNNTLLNVTYNNSKEYVEAGSQLIRAWYYQANITYNNQPVNNANLSAYNVTGVPDGWQFNLTNDNENIVSISSGTTGCSGGQPAVRWVISGNHLHSFIPGSVFLVYGNDISNDGYYTVCNVGYSLGTTFIETTSLSAGHNMFATGGYAYSALTNITSIIDYINTGTRNYYSNYTINTTNGSLSEGHQLNVTEKSLASGFGGLIFENVALGGNIPPQIISWTIDAGSPTACTTTTINYVNNHFRISVSDSNGWQDMQANGNVKVYFGKSGVYRPSTAPSTPASCAYYGNDGVNTVYFDCSINMNYYDDFGNWNVYVSADDGNGGTDDKISDGSGSYPLFNYLALAYERLTDSDGGGSAVVEWNNPPITLATTDQESNTYLIVENCGNVNLNLQATAQDLKGSVYTADFIAADSFSVGTDTAGSAPCNVGQVFFDDPNTAVSVANSLVLKSTGTPSSRNLYFCLEEVKKDSAQLRPDSYTSVSPWTVTGVQAFILSIIRLIRFNLEITLLAAVVVGRRKEKKSRKILTHEELLSLDLLLRKKYEVGLDELLEHAKKKELREVEVEIPICVFRNNLSPAEALCKYMKENLGLRYSEIAKLINRDERTVWINYNNSKKKMEEEIKINKREIRKNRKTARITKSIADELRIKDIQIPISLIANRKLSILENIVNYLKEKGLKNIEIARLLGKDSRNIYTLYSRTKRKLG